MKLLITPCIDRIPNQGQASAQLSLQQFITTLNTAPTRTSGQTIELQNDQLLRTQINSVLDNLDIDALFDPTLPNIGGMEVMATIKRDLSLEIETLLATQ